MDAIKGLILGMVFAGLACFMQHAKSCDGLMLTGLSIHSRDRGQYNALNVGAGCVKQLSENWRGMVGFYYNSNRYWSQELVAEYTVELLPGHRVGVLTGLVWYSHKGIVLTPATRHRINKDWELDTMLVIPGRFQPLEKYKNLPGVAAFYLVRWF